MQKLLFISHAAPEDNYFAGWLASKLKLLGYKVWVDVKDLRAGSSFWNEIEIKMRNDSIRFIALVSSHYIEKSRKNTTGVFSEITLAKTLSKKIEKYIIPIKVDDSSYDDFPINILPLDTVDFSNNWGVGIQNLLSELEEQNIPKSSNNNNVLSQWHDYQKISGKVIQAENSYGSNWFKIEIPTNLYVYKFHGDYKNLYNAIPFGFVRNGDYVIGFFEDSGLDFNHTFKEGFSLKEFIVDTSIILSNGDEIKDTHQKLVFLLNRSIENYFYGLDNFGVYKASNKKKVFYPKFDESKSGYISLKLFGKRGRKLYSKDKNTKWRFGLSFLTQLEPFPHVITNYHLISSGDKGLLSNDEQVKARRSIPNEWYNRDWYERILAFLFLASGSSKELLLKVPVGTKDLIIDITPVKFNSDYGYEE